MSGAGKLKPLLQEACGPVFPGCALAVHRQGHPWLSLSAGVLGSKDEAPDAAVRPVTAETLYDVASVTKALVTAPLLMRRLAEGRLDLDAPVASRSALLCRLDPRITFRHLAAHRAGLPAWRPFYIDLLLPEDRQPRLVPGDARSAVLEQILRGPLLSPPGDAELYSDLGYMLLGWCLEEESNTPLDRQFQDEIAGPLRLDACFTPLTQVASPRAELAASRIAPTEAYEGRTLARGQVHDDNAFALGGVAGHAGLFATAEAIARLGDELLRARQGQSAILDQAAARAFLNAARPSPPETRIPGYDTPTPGASSAGQHFSPGSFGHLGFTGCSLWCDPERQLSVAFLSNRVHPTRENEAIRAFRPRLHDEIANLTP